jgi:ribosome modulation factor
MAGFDYDKIRERGYIAALAGKPRSACPYPDKRKPNGKVTFSRAFRNAWLSGWDDFNGVSNSH